MLAIVFHPSITIVSTAKGVLHMAKRYNANSCQGFYQYDDGCFLVFWHDDSHGWFWADTKDMDFDFESAVGPYETSFGAFTAAFSRDFSINQLKED